MRPFTVHRRGSRRMGSRHPLVLLVGLICLVFLTGCGEEGPRAPSFGVGADLEPPSEDTTYDCFGVRATPAELEAAPSVAELEDHPGFEMFAGYTEELDRWRAVVVEEDRLAAIRELDPPDTTGGVGGEVRDHERLEVSLLDEPMPPETDEEGWMVSSSGPCVLQADLGDLEPVAAVHLDDEAPPDDGTAELPLLVVEQGCASGQPATDRVEVEVDESADEIRLIVGVQPPRGDQTCPSNPATPVTVELDEPVGERRVVDASRHPPAEVTGPPQDLQREEG